MQHTPRNCTIHSQRSLFIVIISKKNLVRKDKYEYRAEKFRSGDLKNKARGKWVRNYNGREPFEERGEKLKNIHRRKSVSARLQTYDSGGDMSILHSPYFMLHCWFGYSLLRWPSAGSQASHPFENLGQVSLRWFLSLQSKRRRRLVTTNAHKPKKSSANFLVIGLCSWYFYRLLPLVFFFGKQRYLHFLNCLFIFSYLNLYNTIKKNIVQKSWMFTSQYIIYFTFWFSIGLNTSWTM